MTADRTDSGSRPGVLGDWTEEQNLDQKGDPGARIGREEVDAAFKGDDDRAPAESRGFGRDADLEADRERGRPADSDLDATPEKASREPTINAGGPATPPRGR